MPPQSVEQRVETLEHKVTALEQLPARVTELGSQIAHIRTEMHAEFSAIRGDRPEGVSLTSLQEEIRGLRRGAEEVSLASLQTSLTSVQGEIRAIRGDGAEGVSLASIRQEIRDGDAETRTLMRVLHEDVLQRLELLQESLAGNRRQGAGRKRRGADGKK